MLIHAEIYIYIYWIHILDTYTMIKTQEGLFYTNITSLFIARARKGCVGFYCERELETEHKWNILTPKLRPSALCLSRSPGLLNRRPRAHSAGWWLSLLHLISIFSGPQLIRAQMAPSAWWGFPYHISSPTVCNSTQLARRTQLSYIIVRRPFDLWNRMFNRHQAEITVMQFRGHSLPVHHSVVAQWDLHLVPYYQP